MAENAQHPVTTDWLDRLREGVQDRLDAAMAGSADRFTPVGPEIADLYDVAGSLLAGGKRLRAAFLAAGWRAFGGTPSDEVEILGGSGVELFQMAALVHDDVMDASLTRRGLPAAHRQLAARHRERGMLGDPDRFGTSGALLLGDLLLVLAQSDLRAAIDALPADRRDRAQDLLVEMMSEVTLGQYLDIYAQAAPWSADPEVDLDRARRVIRTKAARYSVEHPLALGVALAGATDAQLAAARAAGLPVGEAFQLRDDVLGVFGDPAVTGKPAGDDLREGKRTVLVTLGMARAGASDRAYLREVVGSLGLGPADVERVREILTATGAADQVEHLIAERAAAGHAAIDALGVPAGEAARLHDLADRAITRSA